MARKVVQINVVPNMSTGRIMMQVDARAREAGYDSYCFYRLGETSADGRHAPIGTPLSVRWHGVMTRLFDRTALHSAGDTRRLLEKLDAIAPDLVHLHVIHGYYIHMPLLFAWLQKKKIPVVWTMHDCWAITGHCAHFDRVGCERWRTGCHHCPQKGVYPASMLLDRSARNHTEKRARILGLENLTVVTPSRWLAGVLQESFLDRYPIRVIANGVDTAAFAPASAAAVRALREKHGLAGKRIYLAVASSWTEAKGLSDLRAMAALLREDECIVIVGLAPGQISGMPEGILGLGRTDGMAELAAWYTAADCLINPTLEDTFPTVNLESMACGTPVAAYRTGGCPEQLEDAPGRVTEKGDAAALLDAARALAAEEKPAAACRDHVLAHYDAEKQYPRYLELYEKLLGEA